MGSLLVWIAGTQVSSSKICALVRTGVGFWVLYLVCNATFGGAKGDYGNDQLSIAVFRTNPNPLVAKPNCGVVVTLGSAGASPSRPQDVPLGGGGSRRPEPCFWFGMELFE